MRVVKPGLPDVAQITGRHGARSATGPQLASHFRVLGGMRLIAVLAALMVIAATGAAHASAAARTGAVSCPPAHARLIAADAQAVLFEGLDAHGLLKIQGCVQGRHRVSMLGAQSGFSAGGGGGIESERLAGPMVAYDESFLETSPPPSLSRSRWLVVVRDLRTGRVVHKLPTGSTRIPGAVGLGVTRSLVVKSDGATAWIVGDSETQCGAGAQTCNEVHVVDSTGSRIVASAADIDPSSLALTGSRLYWSQGGRAMSAVLN